MRAEGSSRCGLSGDLMCSFSPEPCLKSREAVTEGPKTQGASCMKVVFRNLAAMLAISLLTTSHAGTGVSSADDAVAHAISQADKEQLMLSRFHGAIEGSWTGSFETQSPTPHPITRALELCLEIRGSMVSVFMNENGSWSELTPGQFQIHRYGPSAILYAIGGGETPGGGPWVEAWTISLTQAAEDVVLVRTSRVVNNVDVPYGAPDGRYSSGGEGALQSSQSCG